MTAKQFNIKFKLPGDVMCVHLYPRSDCGSGGIPVNVLQRADTIYGKGFSWRFIAPGCDPPHPEIIGNVSCLINCENPTVSDCSQKTKLKVFVFVNLEMLQGHLVMHVSFPTKVLARRGHARGFLPNVVFMCRLSPDDCNYSGNTSLFVCWNDALACLHPTDQGGCFQWASGEGHCG